ncbi:N-6 DNA methylase [Homoserinibacter sp. GY 40078]|uniref:Eco57I restriction-modification methylase domain-containing protein n=1 Tax=Homoserinibacter sp. GY 40078 TaxID=2603275 RepID=UPI00165041C8|nr:N-6 DNA methylase [Homoserinibacter sp. GY 40078]
MPPTSPTDDSFPEELRARVSSYRERERDLRQPEYKEASTRIEFIDPLFTHLGWDVANAASLPERFKEVVVEPSTDVEGHKRAADYAMRVDGDSRFFVEAKKPSVWIKNQREPAFQARRYAWSAQLPIAVLTNFREFAVYDGRAKPLETDSASKARVLYFTYDELEERWPELVALLGRDAVRDGSLERFTSTLGARGGRERIDRVFLRDLESARADLLAHVATQNPHLTDAELLRAIQLTLDRIIFLRFCEDRLVEPYGTLRDAANSPRPREALWELYRSADSRFNSGLFHFENESGREGPDLITPSLTIDDAVLKSTILRFYPPVSPYAFGVMPVEVMGRAYETFLSQRITRVNGRVALEVKPEVRKAGGVFYTPEWLTAEVVAQTLDPLLEGRTPEAVRAPRTRVRVVDPACGSGTFLVQSYRHLLDWHLLKYTEDEGRWLTARGTQPATLERNALGELALTLRERKRILTDHVFGVDIDAQAVEVAKLSLLLTLMEGQVASSVAQQLAIFHDRILPDLDENVKCGNSLVGPDILSDLELGDVFSPRRARINPFDWRSFDGQFSVVVGNPPWLMAGYEIPDDQLEYLRDKYDSYVGKADLYYLFIERALGLLEDGGRLGFVVPNKMSHTSSARGLRQLLSASPWIDGVVDFQAERLFEEATNYTQVLFASRQFANPTSTIGYTRALDRLAATQSWEVPRARLGEAPWDWSSPDAMDLWDQIVEGSIPLGEIATSFSNGVQSGADPVLIMSLEAAAERRLEEAFLRPVIRGRDVRGGEVAGGNDVLVFPYLVDSGAFRPITASELTRAPWLQAYLAENEAKLRRRKWFGSSALDLTGEWWGMMYLENESWFHGKHLLSPALSNRSQFALGDGRLFLTGTAGVTGIALPDDFDHRPLLAILNSRLISTYALAHSPVYQGEYHKFSAPYVRGLPIREAATDAQREVWTRLGGLWDTRMGLHGRERLAVDARIDDLVNDLYEVDPSQLTRAIAEVAPLQNEDQ